MRDEVDFVKKKDECDEKEKGEARSCVRKTKKVKNEKEDKISSLLREASKRQKTVLLSEQQTHTTLKKKEHNFVVSQQQQQRVCLRTT